MSELYSYDDDTLMITYLWNYLSMHKDDILNNIEIINLYIDKLYIAEKYLNLEDNTPDNLLLGCILITLVAYFKLNNIKLRVRFSLEKEI